MIDRTTGQLAGARALVTGASRGAGEATVAALTELGRAMQDSTT